MQTNRLPVRKALNANRRYQLLDRAISQLVPILDRVATDHCAIRRQQFLLNDHWPLAEIIPNKPISVNSTRKLRIAKKKNRFRNVAIYFCLYFAIVEH